MVESEFDIQRVPEDILSFGPDLAARLINAHLGRVHINEAVAATTFSDGSVQISGVVDIAVINAAASISPNTNIDVLSSLREIISDSGHKKNSIAWGVAHIDALMGNYKTAERNVSAFRPQYSGYLLAGRTIAARGEDPTNILRKAEALMQFQNVEESTSTDTDQFDCYNSIGGIYAQAGLVNEARRVFDIAESLLDESRNQLNHALKEASESGLYDDEDEVSWAVFSNNDAPGVAYRYSMLASAYIDAGWYDDAIRVTDKLKDDEDFNVNGVITEIVKNQLQQGSADDAVALARKSGGILYFKTLASKAVMDADQGKLSQKTVEQVQKVIEGAEYLGNDKWSFEEDSAPNTADHKNQARFSMHSADYASILSSLGIAEAMVGNFEAAKIRFSEAKEVIEQVDDWMNAPYMIFDLAIAIDDAGFDASKIFMQALDATEAMPKDEDHWDYKWSTLADMTEQLAAKGHLDLARDALALYNKKGRFFFDQNKSRMLARLGIVELQNGISEIPIPASELQAILTSDNEQAKQSIRYLHEQGVLNIQ